VTDPGDLTLVLPFRLSGVWTLDTTAIGAFAIQGLPASIRGSGDFELVIESIPTNESASELCVRLRTALLWVSLKLDVGILASPRLQGIPADGSDGLDHDSLLPASILPAPGSLFIMVGDPVPQNPVIDPGKFIGAILEFFGAVGAPIEHCGFELAIELYSDVQFERSPANRFLTLMTILEALSDQRLRGAEVCDAIQRWQDELDRMTRASVSEISNVKSALAQLKRESIGKSIADLVALYCNSEKCTWDPSLYSLRNKLIHGSGRPELGRPLFQLEQVVRLTLIGIIQAAAIQAH